MKQLQRFALVFALVLPFASFAADEAKDNKDTQQAQACACAQKGVTCDAEGKNKCPCACVTPASPEDEAKK